MSSYLNIYFKVKKRDMKEPIFILFDSISRNSDIYQTVYEAGNFYSSEGEKKEITEYTFNSILNDLQGQINNAQLYINTAKEVKSPDVQDIVDKKEYLEDLEAVRDYIKFLYDIHNNAEYSDIKGVYCFID